ncbi:hypothetical protein MESS2_760040 [Mesorhizobium metallidurans STM 2683]|uniref:Uncharacterized protein n=1 Tax=Mesorhizobium metallidurans STM 2683 TaxID=1297569 RepID=M5EX31_9HYPH|nr:hypothetical protein MESS2_760040 [Mesorhizobium metallidurans STM 2683]
MFTHTAVPWRLCRLVTLNVAIRKRMHVPIPTESSSPGKPILSKLHRAEGIAGSRSTL